MASSFPDMTDPFREFVDSLLKSPNKDTIAFAPSIHDTQEDYYHDVALKINEIRLMQRDLHRFKPELTFNLVHVAFFLQIEHDILQDFGVTMTLELVSAVEPFVKTCLGRADEVLTPRTDDSSGEHSQPAFTNARTAVLRILHCLNRDLWFKVKKIIDGGIVEFPYPDIYPFLDDTVIGFKPINTSPRQQDPDDPSKDLICVEWRYLPTRVSEAFADPEGEGVKFLMEEPSPEKPATLCKMDVFHPELTSFFERNMHDDRRNEPRGGFPYVSGTRFLISVDKQHADNIFHILEMIWMAFRICSLSGAAESIDHLRGRQDGEWEDAFRASEKKDRETFAEKQRRIREAYAALAEAATSEDEIPPWWWTPYV